MNCEIHCVAADVKQLADTLLGGNSNDSNPLNCKEEYDKSRICPCCHDQRNMSDKSDPCKEENTNTQYLAEPLEGITTHNDSESPPSNDIIVNMAYKIQTANPFSILTSHSQTIWNSGKSTEKNGIVTTEEIEKTPLPKYRRKPFTKKFRQRQCLTPSLQSKVRRILANYKYHIDKDVSVHCNTEFHSGQIENFYQNLTSTETEIYSIKEGIDVPNFNVHCSTSVQSFNSSNIEYEIDSNINVLDDTREVSYKYNESIHSSSIDWHDINQDFDKFSYEYMFSSRSYKAIKLFPELQIFLLLLKQACVFYEEPSMESETEILFIKLIRENMEKCSNFQSSIRFITKCGQDIINPKITSSNYDIFKRCQVFFKILGQTCNELHIPVIPFLFDKLLLIFFF